MLNNITVALLFLGLTAGQLWKFPSGWSGGLTLLDFAVITLNLWVIWKIRFRLKSPPFWTQAGLIFILIAVISLLLTPLRLTSEEYFNSAAYPVRFFLYLLLGWCLNQGVFPGLKKQIYLVLTISGLALAILGLFQLVLMPNLQELAKEGWDPHYFRTVSTLLDPNFLGGYLILTLILLTGRIKVIQPRMFVPIFIVIYLAGVTTFSRSVTLMFLTSFLTLSFFYQSIRLLILTAFLMLGFGLGFLVYEQTIANPRHIDRQQSAQYRLSSWQMGLRMFQERPIIGIGFNAYRYALRELKLAPKEFIQSRGSSASDSSLLFVAATTGIIGLFSYLIFLFLILYTALKNYLSGNRWGLIWLAGTLGIIVQSFFINNLFYPWFLLWIVLVGSQNQDVPLKTRA